MNIKCSQCFYKLFNQRKVREKGKTKNKQRRRIAADMKVKVKHTALTGYLKPKESEEKRENSNDPPPPHHHGVTGITGVTTRRLTGGKISSPSQPYNFPAQFNFNPNQTYLNKLIKVFRINRKLQAAEFKSRYELNSAGMWTSRARAENL